MRRTTMLALALAHGACAFSATDGQLPPGGGGTTPPNEDGCHVAADLAGDLRLCLEFEDHAPMAIAHDASGFGHDATATQVDTARRVMFGDDEQAAQFHAPMSALRVAGAPDLDLADVTIEMFVAIDPGIAPMERYTLLDHSGQYFMSYGGDHEVRCGVAGDRTIDSGTDARPVKIEDAGWHHVACTYDRDELRVYVDGSLADCDEEHATLAVTGDLAIGARTSGTEHLKGMLDNVHVFSRALTPEQICDASGAAQCQASCVIGGDHGGHH